MFRVLALSFLVPAALFGQATTSTIQGVVHDQTGAVVPGAVVTVTSLDTKTSSKWVSSAEGTFTAPFLQPGEYEVTGEKPGFKRLVRRGITLSVADTSHIDLTL